MLILSLLLLFPLSPGPSSRKWCCPQLGWVFPLPLNLSENFLTDMSRDLYSRWLQIPLSWQSRFTSMCTTILKWSLHLVDFFLLWPQKIWKFHLCVKKELHYLGVKHFGVQYDNLFLPAHHSSHKPFILFQDRAILFPRLLSSGSSVPNSVWL